MTSTPGKPYAAAVIVLSDRAASGERPDACIPVIREGLGDVGFPRARADETFTEAVRLTELEADAELGSFRPFRGFEGSNVPVPAEIASEIARHAADERLTAREVEVLKRVAAGGGNKLIAAELAISDCTVRTHMKRILSKLDASGRTHAVMIALKRGILDV